MSDAPLESPIRATSDGSFGTRTAWGTLSRFAVHLGLIVSVAGSLGTLQLLHVRVAYHTVVGLVFVGLVVVHLVQRRHTIARMASQIVRNREFFRRRARVAFSDFLLFFFAANVLASGIVDWRRGAPTQLPLPKPFYRWHLDAGLVLVIYLIVHVWRRRKRVRRSTIR
jgi:hypothetical protein